MRATTWQQPAKLCKSGSSAIAALAHTLMLPVRGHYFSAKDCDSKICRRIVVLIQVVPELFSEKQGMQELLESWSLILIFSLAAE